MSDQNLNTQEFVSDLEGALPDPTGAALLLTPYQARPLFSLSFCSWLAHTLKEAIDQRLNDQLAEGAIMDLATVQNIGAALEGLEILGDETRRGLRALMLRSSRWQSARRTG